MAQVMSFFTPTKRFPLEWSVYGYLDRPWKVNVKARVPITVSQRAKPRKAPRRPARRASRAQGG
jgi:hypothetical protein